VHDDPKSYSIFESIRNAILGIPKINTELLPEKENFFAIAKISFSETESILNALYLITCWPLLKDCIVAHDL
jgi:hypothetical protein